MRRLTRLTHAFSKKLENLKAALAFHFAWYNLVRIHRPELLRAANVHHDYVTLLASASESVETVPRALAAVEAGLADPGFRSDERRAVAADLFYRPGGATARSVQFLYEAVALAPSPALLSTREVTCQPSA